MFTGIINGVFVVTAVETFPGLTRFSVELNEDIIQGLQKGASVAVDGVCLTVINIVKNTVSFEAIQETLTRTTLSSLFPGRRVHIERSLRFGDEVGGHILSGHVYGTGVIEKVDKSSNNHIVTIRCPADWMPYIHSKGFISIDGASLTIVDVKPEGFFTIHLIPETLRASIFASKVPGDAVNIEIDHQTQSIVNTVRRYLEAGALPR